MNTESTLVIQSHTQPLPYPWLQHCLNSVKAWSASNNYDYLFINDELFDFVPRDLLTKTEKQKVIATDLARLKVCQRYLAENYETVVWCDADFYIFNPGDFKLPESDYALGREVWVQANNNNQLNTYTKVHNAFLMFRRGNSFLDFYTETAEKLIHLNQGGMPPQFIGPKLLTALHNIAQCTVLETAGMLSPLVVKDIANKKGAALDLFIRKSTETIAAANICSSLHELGEISTVEIENCIHNIAEVFSTTT